MNIYSSTLFLILFAFSTSLIAQPTAGHLGESDPRAQKVLDRLSEKYKKFNTVRTDFILTIESVEDDINEKQEGKLFLKGDKFRLEFEDQLIISDNKTIWTYLKDVEEVNINVYEEDENSISPSELFTIYERDFLYLLAEEWREGNRNYQKVSLTPIDKSLSYFKIDMIIEKNSNTFVSAKIFDKSGLRFTYEMENFEGNPNLSNALFNFDPKNHPNVMVNDLR
ncbi:MAG: outer membrane lipoprotein carrier protein LolA [Chitinophagaceae bacterium]|nr:MAG: outer membrane lipoprotein carrier protein LolA [Chitinophagaceae bacterium]